MTDEEKARIEAHIEKLKAQTENMADALDRQIARHGGLSKDFKARFDKRVDALRAQHVAAKDARAVDGNRILARQGQGQAGNQGAGGDDDNDASPQGTVVFTDPTCDDVTGGIPGRDVPSGSISTCDEFAEYQALSLIHI